MMKRRGGGVRLSKLPSEGNFKAQANTTSETKHKTIHKTRRQAGVFLSFALVNGMIHSG